MNSSMRQIKPKIRIKRITDKQSGITYYEAHLRVGKIGSKNNAMSEKQAITNCWNDLQNNLLSTFEILSLYNDPIGQLYKEQEQRIEAVKEYRRRLMREEQEMVAAAVEEDVDVLLDVDSLLNPRAATTPKTPWWKRLFRI